MLRLNGIKRIHSVLSLPNRTLPVLRALNIRKSSTLSDSEPASDVSNEAERPSTEAQLEPDVNTFPKRVESPWKIGVYAPTPGGVEYAVKYAASLGVNSFASYISASRKWKSPPLTPESVNGFIGRMKSYGYTGDSVLAHACLLIDLGDSSKQEKSYARLLDDMKRCQELGLKLCNFRPGTFNGTAENGTPYASIAEHINRAHKEIPGIRLVMENVNPLRVESWRQGKLEHGIGPQFSDLAAIIAQVEDKTRIGVSIDICEIFGAGHDIRTKEGWDATISQFDQEIGLKYLCGMSLSDTKSDCNSRTAIRENIGLGHLGFNTFRRILQDPYTQHIPLIVQTPRYNHPEILCKEIEILQALADPETIVSEENLKAELMALVDGIQLKKEEKKAPTNGTEGEVIDETTFLSRIDSPWKVGATVSMSRGVEKAVTTAAAMGANCFVVTPSLSDKSAKSGLTPKSAVTPESASNFREKMKQYGYTSDMLLVRSPQIMDLDHKDGDAQVQALIDNMKKCEELGGEVLAIRPGSLDDETKIEESLTAFAECINQAHQASKTVKLIMEKTPRLKNVLSPKFCHLASIIAKVEDKTRIGVCLNTCHLFAAGHDIRTKEGWDALMTQFDQEVGLKYLSAIILSDSELEFDSKKEIHANIGLGALGISTFRYILQDPRTQNIPLLVAAPNFGSPKAMTGKEIEVLHKLSDPESDKLEEDLRGEIRKAIDGAKAAAEEAKLKREEEQKAGKGNRKWWYNRSKSA